MRCLVLLGESLNPMESCHNPHLSELRLTSRNSSYKQALHSQEAAGRQSPEANKTKGDQADTHDSENSKSLKQACKRNEAGTVSPAGTIGDLSILKSILNLTGNR